MRNLSLTLLSRLGHCRGSSFATASALIDTLDKAVAASDCCSTSSRTVNWGGHSASVGFATQAWRTAHRYNFIQPVDTNHINAVLESATLLEHAAIPVLQYGAWFDPEQVTRTLQRLPRMLRYQRRKSSRAAADRAAVTSWRLMDVLGSRLAQVAVDCTDEQFARAMWAFGVSRRHHAEVIRVACEQLPRRLGSLTMPQLATTAWSLAAATRSAPKPAQESVRDTLKAIARHLVATRPANLSAPSSPRAQIATGMAATPLAGGKNGAAAAASVRLTPAADMVAAAVTAGRAALDVDQPWMDHRSALKLAWAFAALGVHDTQALDAIGDAAAARIDTQMQAHDGTAAPLVPRATFLYWTIRGWQAWPRPRPPRARTGGRPSRYMRDERPRVVLRDFTLPSLAPLLAAFRRLGYRHEGLLQASAKHIVASAGPLLRVAPADLTRLTGAMEILRFRNAPALAALLSCSRLTALPAPVLARLTALAAEWGVPSRHSGGLYGRLARQIVARAWINSDMVGDRTSTVAKDIILQGASADAPAAENLAAAAAATADEVAEIPQLDTFAKESWERQLPSQSWRTDLSSLEREAEQWQASHRRPEDVCGPAELARVLLALAKAGFKESEPGAPLVGALFARVWPHLTLLPGDALAGLALAAAHYGPHMDRGAIPGLPVTHLEVIREVTQTLLCRPATDQSEGLRSLISLKGLLGKSTDEAEKRTASTASEAADLRREMGLSPGGALRLATALTLRPDAVTEMELRAVLSVLALESTERKQLGELIARMRRKSRNSVLPPRLLAAVEEAPQGQ
ncbi:hypothetical protein Vretimale_3194 [Volvox reticuliferus]|uniref:Uncharacterized protein n=1 Tax=Volvox reticuliferus TaxID=1737510 RepID=A0A8J4FMQ2_9CHLO|nr:hypothetical protein Vretifemale_6684 [Volvox reticuliferus]GIL97558.1 hypothetical protein Vretimale_3194 [Volvox reticuliferus]